MSKAEQHGDFQTAYGIAKILGDYWKMDRIAADYNIPNHEFSDLIAVSNENIESSYRRCVGSRLQEGATASRLGFKGFLGKVVLDIGCNDGSYIEMFKNLGAQEVLGVEPLEEALNLAIESGRLDKSHALLGTLQEYELQLKNKIDVAAIFNPEVSFADLENFISSLYRVLHENGQAVFTFAERVRLETYMPFIEKYFLTSEPTRLLGNSDYGPHSFLVIANKNCRDLSG